tara:strand:- start:113 stop:583 length:471 start_codon:yes stop_codon:yes gene_type:complete
MKKLSKYGKVVKALKKRPKKPTQMIADEIGVSASYVYKIKNTVLGSSALASNTTGNNNAAVGHAEPGNTLRWELPDNTLMTASDGSTAAYYELPKGAKELQDLISHRNMNAQIGEVFRSCYRYGLALHSDQLRDAKKIKFYIDAEIKRLEKGNFLK